jgi:hypothetical protein
MPRCYCLAIAESSALDSYTNNWSLFNLVEQLALSEFPAVLPLQVHSFWKFAPDETNIDFQFRLVLIPQEGDIVPSNVLPLKSPTIRYRHRASGLSIPHPGEYELRIEWHNLGDATWVRSDVFWPLQAERIATSNH